MASSSEPGVVSYRTALVTDPPVVAAEIKPAKKKANSKPETPVWKKAVIGGAIAVAVVAAALRLRKADDEGELDDAKDTLKKKGKEVKGESKKAGRSMGDKAKKAGHNVEDKAKDAAGWVQDKSHDVLDSGRHAAEVAGDKLHDVKDAGSDKAHEFKDHMHHAQKDAEAKAQQAEASKEARRMADKHLDEDVGFLGWKNWFGK